MNDQTTIEELAELLHKVAHIKEDTSSTTPSVQTSAQCGGSASRAQPLPVCGRLTPVNFSDLTAWIRAQTPTTTIANTVAAGGSTVSPTHAQLAASSGFSVTANPNTPLRGAVGSRIDAVSPMLGHTSITNGGRSGSIPSEFCGSPSGSAHGPSASPPQEPPYFLPNPTQQYYFQQQQQQQPSPARYFGEQSPMRVVTGTPLKQQQGVPHVSPGGTPLGSAAKFSVDSFRGHVVDAAKDQSGCRALQRALDTLPFDSPEVSCIVDEIFPHVAALMTDPYGNFLIQRLLEVAPDNIRVQLTRSAAAELPGISTTPHGTFTVQKLIESLRSTEEKEIVCKGLASNVQLLMTDANGSHVVQKLLQCLGRQDRQFLYDGICASLVDICCDRQGCCIVQKCVEFAFPEQFLQLRHAVLQNVLTLAVDPYGNYVVANLLDHCHRLQQRHAVDECCLQLTPHLVPLSTNKFSSNVVERALKYCSEHVAGSVIQQLSQEAALREIAFHQFGNYVVQTALVVSPLSLLGSLIRQIQPMLPQLRQFNFGRKIEAKVEAGLRRLQQQHHSSPGQMPQYTSSQPSPNSSQKTSSTNGRPPGAALSPSPQHTRSQQTCTPPPMPPQPLT